MSTLAVADAKMALRLWMRARARDEADLRVGVTLVADYGSAVVRHERATVNLTARVREAVDRLRGPVAGPVAAPRVTP